jgi:DNA-binding MarR family transcriptional regulator
MKKQSDNHAPAQQVRMNSTGWMLNRLSSQQNREMTSALKQIGLNLNQFAMLMTLLENEGLTQTEIGGKIAMPAYATTRTIDALEAARYVDRRTDERSRRSYRIYLTKKGREAGPALFAIVDTVNAGLLSALPEQDQVQFKEILHKILSSRAG